MKTNPDKYIHGCWASGTDRVCEDGTKGCSRTHPLRVEAAKRHEWSHMGHHRDQRCVDCGALRYLSGDECPWPRATP